MYQMKQLTKYIILLAIACSCNETPESEIDTNDYSEQPQETISSTVVKNKNEDKILIDDNSIVLDGIYATSTALPFKSFHVHNIFDGDDKSYWKTIPGAGTEEGVMMYFQEPTFVSKIELLMASGENLGKVLRYEIYADGNTYYSGKGINREISNLYIRIGKIKESKSTQSKAGAGTWTQTSLPKNLSVGIATLRILDRKGEELAVVAPKIIKGKTSASSTLSPDITYGVSNLMDSRLDFGWAEGTNGNGKGESLQFDFDSELPIEGFKIWNGYQRSQSHFQNNSRAKRISFKGEALEYSFNTDDLMGGIYHSFEESKNVSEIKITIDEVNKGNSYEDLVISELKLYTTNKRPVVIQNSETEKAIQDLRNTSNQILKKYLDRNIQLSYTESISEENRFYYRGINNSFILRSNNSFVLYQSDAESEESEDTEGYDLYETSEERISDGSWELLTSDDDKVTIKLFGKLYVPQKVNEELYGGTSQKDETRIFKDVITLTKSGIKGNKVMGELKLIE